MSHRWWGQQGTEAHGFPSTYLSAHMAIVCMQERLPHPGFHEVVAELDRQVVGSNFLDERALLSGWGRALLTLPYYKIAPWADSSCM